MRCPRCGLRVLTGSPQGDCMNLAEVRLRRQQATRPKHREFSGSRSFFPSPACGRGRGGEGLSLRSVRSASLHHHTALWAKPCAQRTLSATPLPQAGEGSVVNEIQAIALPGPV